MDRPRIGCWRHVRAVGRATQEKWRVRAVRKKGRQMFFFFSGKDWKDVCFVLQVEVEVGAQLLRP